MRRQWYNASISMDNFFFCWMQPRHMAFMHLHSSTQRILYTISRRFMSLAFHVRAQSTQQRTPAQATDKREEKKYISNKRSNFSASSSSSSTILLWIFRTLRLCIHDSLGLVQRCDLVKRLCSTHINDILNESIF